MSGSTAPGASAPDLSSSIISFQSIKNHSKQTLLDILDTAPCPQALIVDPVLTNPIGFICGLKEMQEHRVDAVMLLAPKDPSSSRVYQSFHTTFLLRPNPELILQVKDIIFNHRKRMQQQQAILTAKDPKALMKKTTFSIFFVPRRSMLCESILSNYDLTSHPDVTIGEFPLDLIPCDSDLLSLELPGSFSKIFIDGDTSALFTIALSVIRLQVFFGVIPLIKGIGKASHRVAELIHRLSCEFVSTGRRHSIDFGGSDSTKSSSIHTIPPESASYSIFTALQSESPNLDQLNHSILGTLAFSGQSGAQNDPLSPKTAPNALALASQQQQQKSSLSTQLSSLLNITGNLISDTSNSGNNMNGAPGNPTAGSGGPNNNTIIGPNNNLNNNNATGTAGSQSNTPPEVHPNMYDLSKPRINVPYIANPVINSYTTPQITQVMFIDRTADMISPMLLQRTFEGLIDELIGINTQTIEYSPDEVSGTTKGGVNGPSSPGAKKKMSLHNNDVLFAELRDVNIKVLASIFTEKWSIIKRAYAQTDDMMGAKVQVSDMEKVFKQFKSAQREHNLLPIYWSFAQKIKDFLASRAVMQFRDIEEALLIDDDLPKVEKWIETSIMKSIPFHQILRVIILYASLYGSIPPKKTDQWRRDIVQTYGMDMMPLLINLQHLGIFSPTTPTTASLIPDEQSIQDSMIQYGIASLSPRLPGMGAQANKEALAAKREQIIKVLQTAQPALNNDMNIHIAISRSGSAPHAPIIRKPVWDKLSARLKLIQTPEHLISVQQNAFNKTNAQQSNQLQNEKKTANLQTLLREPIDINFGFGNFYAPLSIRFVEMAAQPGGLKRLQEHLQVQSLLFATPFSAAQDAASASSLSSTFFSTSAQPSATNLLQTTTTTSSQLSPGAISPATAAIQVAGAGPVATSVATGTQPDTVIASTTIQIASPSLFEYRQTLPTSLQQRMRIPDASYFNYPLLSTAMVPLTAQQIAQQTQYDSNHAMFLPPLAASNAPKRNNNNNNQPNQPNHPQNDDKGANNKDQVDLTQSGDDENKRLSTKPVCLVYFIGGATHAEIAMLRYLTDHPTHKYAYVIATTKMTNAKNLINELQRGSKEVGAIFD